MAGQTLSVLLYFPPRSGWRFIVLRLIDYWMIFHLRIFTHHWRPPVAVGVAWCDGRPKMLSIFGSVFFFVLPAKIRNIHAKSGTVLGERCGKWLRLIYAGRSSEGLICRQAVESYTITFKKISLAPQWKRIWRK